MAEPVVADRSVVAFDIGILLRITGLDVVPPDTLPRCPKAKGAADVLWAAPSEVAPSDPTIVRTNIEAHACVLHLFMC